MWISSFGSLDLQESEEAVCLPNVKPFGHVCPYSFWKEFGRHWNWMTTSCRQGLRCIKTGARKKNKVSFGKYVNDVAIPAQLQIGQKKT